MTDPVCPPGTPFAAAVDSVRRGTRRLDEAVAGLLRQLTDDELLWLLDGDAPTLSGMVEQIKRYNGVPIEAGRIDRLGIPGIRFTDGPRGVVVRSSTAFPVPMARAASWDPDLERAVGHAIGAEARAQGANLFAGICINLAYSPGWGRAQESYGEDPLLLGAMGSALAEGVRPWVMAGLKYFALYSMEEARFRVDVRAAEDVMREVYLPHFRTVIESGVDAVMSSYNSVNGERTGEHRFLLSHLLRGEWGFPGFVMSDFFWGLRHPVESVTAGQDLELPIRQQRAAALPAALADGRLARADVERAATRLLRAQVELALRARPAPPAGIIACAEHRALAREVARRGAVLLRNEPVDGVPLLPLAPGRLRRLAVLGRLADQANEGDVASSRVYPPSSSTILAGLREDLGDRVEHVGGSDPGKAAAAARTADAAVVVVGLSALEEGESLVGVDTEATQLFGGVVKTRPAAAVLSRMLGVVAKLAKWSGDRRDLGLRAEDVTLVRAVAAVNPRTVVVVVGGGTVVLDPWDVEVAGLLLVWYPGMEGGRAVADVLLGRAEPGGRLPVAIPRRQTDLPVLDWDAHTVTYDRWWGQRKLDRDGVDAAYPLGFGLGYTAFALHDLTVGAVRGERFAAAVSVTNTGWRTGRHVVQVYAHQAGPDGRPFRALVGFRSVLIPAGETVRVMVFCTTRPLQRWVGDHFELPRRPVRLEAASHAGDPYAVARVVELAPAPAPAAAAS